MSAKEYMTNTDYQRKSKAKKATNTALLLYFFLQEGGKVNFGRSKNSQSNAKVLNGKKMILLVQKNQYLKLKTIGELLVNYIITHK